MVGRRNNSAADKRPAGEKRALGEKRPAGENGASGAAPARRPRLTPVRVAALLAVAAALVAGVAAAFALFPPAGLSAAQEATGAKAAVDGAFAQLAAASGATLANVADVAREAGGTSVAGLERAVRAEAFAAERPALNLAELDFGAVPAGDEVASFSLTGGAAPAVSAESLAAVNAALAQLRALGSAGFVLVDCASGAGLAAGADTAVYGASTYKAPYACYVCEQLVDGGAITLDSACPVTPGLNYESTFGLDASSYPVRTLLEALITQSDNDAFRVLRGAYDRSGYNAWTDQFGDAALRRGGLFYPTYCARTSAKLWAHLYAYGTGGSPTGAWLWDLLSKTEISFLRAGVERADLPVAATVRNKAGWYADADEPQYNCTSDAGIVQVGGSTYLASIMTSAPTGGAATEAYEDLAAALFNEDVLLALR